MPQGKGAPERIEPQSLGDYLEVMGKSVFQSSMSYRVVESKWPSIREAFHDFDIDALAQDTRVIRNRRKLAAIVGNANRIIELDGRHGSFRDYLRSHDDFAATVASLRKEFKFLGDTGCYFFLWVVGEDVPPHEEWIASRPRRS